MACRAGGAAADRIAYTFREMTLPPNESYLLAMYQQDGGGVGLDYGCGDGKLVGAARDLGHDLHGVENYLRLARIGRRVCVAHSAISSRLRPGPRR